MTRIQLYSTKSCEDTPLLDDYNLVYEFKNFYIYDEDFIKSNKYLNQSIPDTLKFKEDINPLLVRAFYDVIEQSSSTDNNKFEFAKKMLVKVFSVYLDLSLIHI